MKLWSVDDLSLRMLPYHGVICIRHWDRSVVTCLIPFNIPARLAVIAWRWLQVPFRSAWMQPPWWGEKLRAPTHIRQFCPHCHNFESGTYIVRMPYNTDLPVFYKKIKETP